MSAAQKKRQKRDTLAFAEVSLQSLKTRPKETFGERNWILMLTVFGAVLFGRIAYLAGYTGALGQ